MNDLARRLRALSRTVLMLQTELRQGHLDEDLIADIERQMEHGIGLDPRCDGLRAHVDALRESVLTPRPQLMADAIRACEKLRDAITDVVDRLG